MLQWIRWENESMNTLDFLSDAANRVLNGDASGISWTWHQLMNANDRLAFDLWLVKANDPLAHQPGTPWSRFVCKVNRMAELERGRREGSSE